MSCGSGSLADFDRDGERDGPATGSDAEASAGVVPSASLGGVVVSDCAGMLVLDSGFTVASSTAMNDIAAWL